MSDPRISLPEPQTPLLNVCHVIAPCAPLYDNRGLRQSLQTELLHGQGFRVYGAGRDWLWGQAEPLIKGSQRPGYVGYVSRAQLSDEVFDVTHIVTALRAPVFSKVDIKSHIIHCLPMNAHVQAQALQSVDEAFIQLAAGAYIHRQHLIALDETPRQLDYVAIAHQHLGTPYVWGGTGLVGLDCSGLVQMALCAVGYDAPRDADMQEENLGQEFAGPLKRGDLVFWPGHVGIMFDERSLLHANAFHMKTSIESYEEAVARIGDPRSLKRL